MTDKKTKPKKMKPSMAEQLAPLKDQTKAEMAESAAPDEPKGKIKKLHIAPPPEDDEDVVDEDGDDGDEDDLTTNEEGDIENVDEEDDADEVWSEDDDNDDNDGDEDPLIIPMPLRSCMRCSWLMPDHPKGKEYSCTDHPRCPAKALQLRYFPVTDSDITDAVRAYLDPDASDPEPLLNLHAKVAELGDDVARILTSKISEAMRNSAAA